MVLVKSVEQSIKLGLIVHLSPLLVNDFLNLTYEFPSFLSIQVTVLVQILGLPHFVDVFSEGSLVVCQVLLKSHLVLRQFL